jgi:hypothetical protein
MQMRVLAWGEGFPLFGRDRNVEVDQRACQAQYRRRARSSLVMSCRSTAAEKRFTDRAAPRQRDLLKPPHFRRQLLLRARSRALRSSASPAPGRQLAILGAAFKGQTHFGWACVLVRAGRRAALAR